MVEGSADGLGAGGVLTIDLAALRSNYERLAGAVAPADCGAVVKADAYGLGASRVGPVLHRAGCRNFFVARLAEGLALRSHLPPHAAITILNGLQPGAEEACVEAGLVPVLNGLDQVEAWIATAVRLGRRLPGALQVDTGMSRLGLSPGEVEALAARADGLARLHVRLVMSHLACADEPWRAENRDQLRSFDALLDRLPRARLSLANSGGIALGKPFHRDLARPGIALYGVGAAPADGAGLRPVVTLEARVIQVRQVQAGAAVGYGGAFAAPRPMRLATLAVGYADRWPRHLGDGGCAFAGGHRLPITGRVSMDSMTVDVTNLPEGSLRLGSLVELIGPHQTLDEVAALAGTIPYEILTRLGRRYERRYLGGPDAGTAGGAA